MAITKERFEEGLTYAAYKEQMTRNRDRLETNERLAEFASEDLAYFSNLPQPLNVMALAEDWCGDVLNNLPVVAKVAEASGKINLRIFLRDQNLDLMDQYLKEGQFQSIPVVAIFDENFHEFGHWIERPAQIAKMHAEMRSQLFATDPLLSSFSPTTSPADLPEEARNRLGQAFSQFREENRNFSDREVVRELRSLVEHGSLQNGVSAKKSVVKPTASPSSEAVSKSARAKVSITYCAECGYEPQTLALAGALMKEFLHEIASIEILPWQDGAFDVHVNGDLVHSMYRDGGFPENATVIQAVRERMAK